MSASVSSTYHYYAIFNAFFKSEEKQPRKAQLRDKTVAQPPSIKRSTTKTNILASSRNKVSNNKATLAKTPQNRTTTALKQLLSCQGKYQQANKSSRSINDRKSSAITLIGWFFSRCFSVVQPCGVGYISPRHGRGGHQRSSLSESTSPYSTSSAKLLWTMLNKRKLCG